MKNILFLTFTITAFSSFAMGSRSVKKGQVDKKPAKDLVHSFYTLKGSISAIKSNDNPKMLLNKILNLAHKTQPNQPDELVDSCEGIASCTSPQKLSYKSARVNLFGDIHLQKDQAGEYFIKDVYCLKEYTSKDFPEDKGIGPKLIPEHTILNTEHTWPKYRFLRNETGLPKSERKSDELYNWKVADLHILYPSNSKDNNIRQNYQFGIVASETKQTVCAGTKLGKVALSNGDLSEDLYFEPPVESRGNIARALFYFSVRYNVPIHPVEEAFLKSWHEADPVDAMELLRNTKIYELQKVRNPFIDMPEIVESISDF